LDHRVGDPRGREPFSGDLRVIAAVEVEGPDLGEEPVRRDRFQGWAPT
jgi:hypothetical protein